MVEIPYKKINFKYSDKVTERVTIFDIELPGRINIIGGYSATGKTFLVRSLDNLIMAYSEGELKELGLGKNIIIIKNTDRIGLNYIRELKNCLIVIDEADLILNNQWINNINCDKNNQYLIFTRCDIGLSTIPTCTGKFIAKGNTITTEYLKW